MYRVDIKYGIFGFGSGMVNKGRHFCISIIAKELTYGMYSAQVFHVEIYWSPRIPKFKNQKSKIFLIKYRLCMLGTFASHCFKVTWQVSRYTCFKTDLQLQNNIQRTKLTEIQDTKTPVKHVQRACTFDLLVLKRVGWGSFSALSQNWSVI